SFVLALFFFRYNAIWQSIELLNCKISTVNSLIGGFPVMAKHIGVRIHKSFVCLSLYVVHATTTQFFITGNFTYKEVAHVGELMFIVHGGVDTGHHLCYLITCTWKIRRSLIG